MDILYLHQYFVPPEGAGGTRSYELARRLVARGHRVTLVTSSAMFPDVADRGPMVRRDLEGIELWILPVAYSNAMSHGERVRAFLRFMVWSSAVVCRRRWDVVFATSTPLTIAVPGWVARLRSWAPMVFEVRDLWPEMPVAVGALRSPVARGLARALEWGAYHGSGHIVALSPGIAQGVERRGVRADRITVIPNGCDLDAFAVLRSEVDDCRARMFPDLRPDQPLVLYAGTLGRINGVGWLIRVAAEVADMDPEVRFAIVGDGAERPGVRASAEQLGVLDRTLWMRDPVPKSTVPALLGTATVATSLFLPIPQMENNSANKFFDALAAGRALAINYGGWHAELLRATGAGLTWDHGDVVGAARSLVAFVRDPGAIERSGAAARRLAEHRFARADLAEAMEGVLCRVTQRGSGTRRDHGSAGSGPR